LDHEELQEKLRKAMGMKIPMAARERWGKFIKERATEFTLRYEWVVDNRFFEWCLHCPDIDFGEGSETITVWTV